MFEGFHHRWRARTTCLPDYREGYEDRCGDGTPAAAGTCLWMGEATVCGLRRRGRARWLMVREFALRSYRGGRRPQLRDSPRYLFGFGMQDVAGGLIAARVAIAAGNRELRRLAAGPPPANLRALAARIARLDRRTEPESTISRRLGLGDCLARPTG